VIYIDYFGNIYKKTTGHAGAQATISQDQMGIHGFAPHRLNAITNPNGACFCHGRKYFAGTVEKVVKTGRN